MNSSLERNEFDILIMTVNITENNSILAQWLLSQRIFSSSSLRVQLFSSHKADWYFTQFSEGVIYGKFNKIEIAVRHNWSDHQTLWYVKKKRRNIEKCVILTSQQTYYSPIYNGLCIWLLAILLYHFLFILFFPSVHNTPSYVLENLIVAYYVQTLCVYEEK